jgi:pimeloyl-ACP methyl ester carboxylesterase
VPARRSSPPRLPRHLAHLGARAAREAGFETAHIAGNSLGGHVALQLAARGRARTVVALAPAGGWAAGDESWKDTLRFQLGLYEQTKVAAPRADAILATPEDRLLPWPSAAARYREDWLPHADWVELEGVGHCPQLDVPLEAAQLTVGFTT